MKPVSRVRYLLSLPARGVLFTRLGARALRGSAEAHGLTAAQIEAFVSGLWTEHYSKIRHDPWEFLETFGQVKLRLVLRMARHAAKLYAIELQEVVRRGRWERRHEMKERWGTTDSPEHSREQWGSDDIVFWYVIASLKWEETAFDPAVLKGATVLDYGASIGTLAGIARMYGAEKLLLVDVDGAPLRFAKSHLGSAAEVLPVTSESAPDGLSERRVDVAYCYHVLEHLTDPVAILRVIHQALKPGGLFYVTFVSLPNTEGGCNLKEAQRLRPEALRYLREQFDVVRWNERRVEYVLRKR